MAEDATVVVAHILGQSFFAGGTESEFLQEVTDTCSGNGGSLFAYGL